MQVSKTTSASIQNAQLEQFTQTPVKKTDEYLFEENNKIITFKADISDPTLTNSAPAIIGAMLSTFADEVISILGLNDEIENEIPEDEQTDIVTPTSGTTNYIA